MIKKKFSKKISLKKSKFFTVVFFGFLLLIGVLSGIPKYSIAQQDYNSTVQKIISQSPTGGPKLDYSGLVQCDGVVNPNEPDRKTTCDFAAFMKTVNHLINTLFLISIPIATVLFAWAGLLFIQGTPGSIKKGKDIFTTVGIGFIIMLTAWFLVSTALDWFVNTNSGATTLIGK